MTTTSPRPASPAPAPATEKPRFGMWVIALMVAVTIAVLGAQTAMGAVQHKQYSQDRTTTIYFLRNGNSIATSMERLQELNAKDRVLMRDSRTALAAGDRAQFNRLQAQAELNGVEQLSLRQQVMDYQEAFDKAFLR